MNHHTTYGTTASRYVDSQSEGESDWGGASTARIESAPTRKRKSNRLRAKADTNDEYDLEMRQDDGIHQNIRGIRAILPMNQEIWNRCKRSLGEAAGSDPGSMMFTRYGYEEVNATSVNEELLFTATVRRTDIWFCVEILHYLPAELNPNNMFQPPYSKDDSGVATKFIDYDLFFENSLSLHDTILKPFLATLKDHLEAVQVCLGKIDEWLMVSHNNTDFLEKTFGKKLVIPNIASIAKAHQLKTSHMYGTYTATFNISEKSQQIQLEKVLDFVSTVGQD
jgi:hypothetical protein